MPPRRPGTGRADAAPLDRGTREERILSLSRLPRSAAQIERVRRLTGLPGGREAVADAADRLDVARMVLVALELRTEPADIHLQVVHFVAVLRSPYARQKRAMLHDAAAIRHEVNKEVVLGRREPDRVALHRDLAPGEVDAEPVVLERLRA